MRTVQITITVLLLLAGSLTSLVAQPVTDGAGDVGIGTLEPDPSALLDLTSTIKGLLLPRMTTAQREAITNPATGLLIYNTEDSIIQWNHGTFMSPEWYTVVGVDFAGNLQAPLSPGALWYGGANGIATELAVGAPRQILQVNAVGTAPEWTSNLLVVNISATGDLSVAGLSTLNDLMVAGTQTNSGDLILNGGALTTSAGTTATFNGPVDINNDVVIDGDLANSGDAAVATAPGSNASIGNPTGVTDLNGSDVDVGADAMTIDIGNAGSTTTIDGTVVFNNLPDLPLSEDAMFVGNSSDVASELASTNEAGAVLQQDSTGTPTWSRDLDVDNVTVDGDLAVAGTPISPAISMSTARRRSMMI